MSEKNYDKLLEKYSYLFITDSTYPIYIFGFECGIGWYDLLDKLLSDIDTYLKTKDKDFINSFKITQVKEKFGELRFNYFGGDELIDKMVSDAENLSCKTCEFCGSTENVMCSSGWIITACKVCVEANEKLKNRMWTVIK